MARKPLVLVIGASAGHGHMVAARAVAEAVAEQRPDVDVEVHDVLAYANVLFRTLYAGGYAALVRHAPGLMGWIYDLADAPEHARVHALRLAFEKGNTTSFRRLLEARRPNLIINTHFLPAELIADLRRRGPRGGLSCPQVVATTDFDAHRIWVQDPSERYYAATGRAARYLQTWGITCERIVTTGIPVRAGFSRDLSRAEARRACGLPAGSPVVLLLCNNYGPRLTVMLLEELTSMPVEASIVAIVGREAQMHRAALRGGRSARPTAGESDACSTPSAYPPPEAAPRSRRLVRIVGFTETMWEWMRAADLAVTKAGGLTTAEALACGLPLVVFQPIPGQETRNSDYLLEIGAGIRVHSPRMIGARVSELLSEPEVLRRLHTNAAGAGRPNAAREIAVDALRLL